MKLLGLNVPIFRKGEIVMVREKTHTIAIKDKSSHRLNPKNKYEWCEYPFIVKRERGTIVSLGKWRLPEKTIICYGVLVKGRLYAVKEEDLLKVGVK